MDRDIFTNLEEEAFYVIERAFKSYEKIGLLFSGGKDSSVLLYLVNHVAQNLNRSFKIINIDTGEHFPEMLSYIKETCSHIKKDLIIKKVDQNKIPEISLNRAQSFALKETIDEEKFDIIFGGARRDEDKARQKELFFSRRKNNGGWEPEKQSAEIWPWFNLTKDFDEHFRVFPLNNWTEIDVLIYSYRRNINLCPLYFSHPRAVWLDKKNTWQLVTEKTPKELIEQKNVRFRTIGDKTNSLPMLSNAFSLEEVISEVSELKTPERGLRADDTFSEFSMEIRKKEGYF